ncbi:hypothetical protein [Neomegalonema sp.]|uniref:hypothetical protein n=1 Tax=Neomegalonema sp. TaxID=2039713 RepID=UPI002630C567|nr:hypothetical protein [Neomegalonema sp.]MDD2866962.1 hypothetical protein [Neomegalonema sp.]
MRKFLTAAFFTTAAAFAAQSPAEAAWSGGFSLTLPQGAEDSAGRVALNDAPSYRICLRSDRGERVDVELVVGDRFYGAYRLEAYGSTCLDRMIPDAPRFAHGGWSQLRPGLNEGIVARFVPLQEWTSYAHVADGSGGFRHLPRPSFTSRDYDRAVTLDLRAQMRPGPWFSSPWISYPGF